MKTYKIIYVLMALLIGACSTSDEGAGGEKEQNSTDADYVALLTNEGMLRVQLLNASAEVITLNTSESSLTEGTVPQLTSIRGTEFFQYHKDTDCSGTVIRHDFSTDTMEEIALFGDRSDCLLSVNAITFWNDSLYIAYELEIDSKTHEYMIRVVDLNSGDLGFDDIHLNKKPVDLAVANSRLFIMTHDIEVSDENYLSVMDLGTHSMIHEKNLGFRARRIFNNTDDDIVISYDELHTTLNSSNMSVVYTNYQPGVEPRFTANTTDHFDLNGRLYYPIISGAISAYPEIPAVYDFSQNLLTMYAFENFLTEEKRELEFKIETATAINYDRENNLMLIGYKKLNKQEGGLLRIKPAPDPAFVDNIDLDGVPYEILIN